MNKHFSVIASLMLIVVLAINTSCKKDNTSENGGGTTEGLYLGIIGFNDQLTTKEIGLLTSSSKDNFTSFIDNLTMRDGTALYHADYTALDKLEKATKPQSLINVSLVTFTDGLDNASLMLNSSFDSQSQFLSSLNTRIVNDQVDGIDISAYAIGLKGNDVNDEDRFRENLQKLSSDPANVFEVANMNEATERFSQIAEQLYNVSTLSNIKLKVPGGYDNNTKIRLTFDNVSNANQSSRYIEGNFKRENGSAVLTDVVYHNLTCESGTSIVASSQEGTYYWFTFTNLLKNNGTPVTSTNNCKLWQYITSTSSWQPESEFSPSTFSEIVEERKSAMIVLVLDCTTSLGDDFNKMKQASKQFVETLCSSNNSGSGNGGYIVPEDKTFTANGVSFKMVYVEGSTFTMGATPEQGSDVDDDEKPTHSVTLNDYYIEDTEVTQALWQAVMGGNPSYYTGGNHPAEYVSWNDCQEFITKLNQLCAGQLNGMQFALPTEAEWEYAARGGMQSCGYKYSGSNSLGNVAWYTDNSGNTPHAVGTKQANELGLYDMSGNVFEWCYDWFGSYTGNAQNNPIGPSIGSARVYRGGSWIINARSCCVSVRSCSSPDYRYSDIGFRLALR